MKTWSGWHTLTVLAGVISLLLLTFGDLSERHFRTTANILILASFAGVWLAAHRVLNGDRPWQRLVQASVGRPMAHWNDWRMVALLAGSALGFHLLEIVDLPERDRWSAVGVLLLLVLCLAAQMINVAFFRKRGRK
jgi:hypothetical protein